MLWYLSRPQVKQAIEHRAVMWVIARNQLPVSTWRMDPAGLDELAREICELLQQQIEAVVGRKFNDFKDDELAAYEKRKRRIAELRSELQKFVRPA